jgi:hypothetical protein
MIFNIAYAKKTFRLFCPKKPYMIHFFLIAMNDWWFVIVCCLIEDCSAKDRVPNIPNITKIITDLWINFIGNCDRERFLGVPFRNSLKVLGVVNTSHGMIRG